MRFGLAVGLAGSAPSDDVDLVGAAEAGGFDTVSVGEAGRDTFVQATLVATASRRLRVYSGIAAWTRPPLVTATAMATVDRIAEGRYTLGLGTMPAAWNTERYGIDPSHPLDRMREYVDVLRRVMTAGEGPVEVAGPRFRVSGFRWPEPPVRAAPPIHLAATRPGMARLAGEVADGVLFNVLHTAGWMRDVLGPAVADGAAGRTVEQGVMVRCAVTDDEDAGLHALRRSLRLYLEVPYLYEVAEATGHDLSAVRERVDAGDPDAWRALPEGFVRACSLLGSAAACRDQAARYEGLVDWVLLVGPGGLGAVAQRAASMRIIEAFARTPAPGAVET